MIEAMKQALEALEEFCAHGVMIKPIERRDALRQAIAEFDSHTLYREGYVNGYAFGEAAGKQAIAELESQYPHGMYGAEDLDKAWKSGYDNCKDQFAYLDEQEPVAWLLTEKNINSLQVDSIQLLINRLKHAHHTDLCVRINGQDEWFQADWLKHMVRVTPPQRTEQEPVAWADIGTRDVDNDAGLSWTHGHFHTTPLYTHPPQRTEQEPVAFAGVEMWIGNTRIKKLMTQAELHFAIDPWAIVKFHSDSCIDALKEKNND